MQKFIRTSRVIQLASFLVVFPNLLQANSLWLSNNKQPDNHERWRGHVLDDLSDSNYHFVSKQNLKLYKLANKASPTVSSGKNGYKYSKTKTPYSYDQGNLNHYGNNRPDCNDQDEEFEHRKKIWKASLILGSVGFALGKLGLISIVSPFLFVEDTTTSTSTTSTTSTSTSTTSTSTTSTSTTSTSTTSTSTTSTTTTPTTTTSTTSTTTTPTTTTSTTSTSTTTIAPVTCSQMTTLATGDYKTIRNPGGQTEQCISITVAVGSRIAITCTSVYAQAGTYQNFYTLSGTSLITSMVVVGTTYTSTDNTLLITSLAGNAIGEVICCTWTTVP